MGDKCFAKSQRAAQASITGTHRTALSTRLRTTDNAG
jgi:hypothetical protein